MKKTKISSRVLVDRKFDGKSTDSETFSRARQLAIMGVVGYDLTKKEFYIDAEFIGESAS